MLEPVIFFFVSLARVGVWLLFNRLLALLVALFYVIREFDMLLLYIEHANFQFIF